MISDAIKIYTTMRARGLLDAPQHRTFAKAAKTPALMLRLDPAGAVESFRFHPAEDADSFVTLTAKVNGRLWPLMYQMADEDAARELPAKAKGGSFPEHFAKLLELFSEGEDSACRLGYLRRLNAGLRVSAGVPAEMKRRIALFMENNPSLSKVLQDATAKADGNATDWLAGYLTKKVIVAFDLAEGGFHTPATRRALSEQLFAAYGTGAFGEDGAPLGKGAAAAEEGVPAKKPRKNAQGVPVITDVVTGEEGPVCMDYPKIVVGGIGEVYLFSRNSITAEATGYGLYKADNRPHLTTETVNAISDAVRQLFSAQNEGKLWRKTGGKNILAAIPGWEGGSAAGLMWDAPEVNGSTLTRDLDSAQALLDGFDAGTASSPNASMLIFMMTEIDNGNKRWSGIFESRASEYIEAVRRWHRPIAGPDIAVKVWQEKKQGEKRPPLTARLADRRIGVFDAVDILNTLFVGTPGNKNTSAPITSTEAIVECFLHGTPQQYGAAALANCLDFLLATAKVIRVGGVPANGLTALQIYRTFQLLFPAFMTTDTPAYHLGRLLARADGLHSLRQKHSGGEYAGDLCGARYAKVAVQAPRQAVDFLAGELMPLLAWARNPSPTDRGLRFWFISEINESLQAAREIPATLHPEAKMQLLIGYSDSGKKQPAEDAPASAPAAA